MPQEKEGSNGAWVGEGKPSNLHCERMGPLPFADRNKLDRRYQPFSWLLQTESWSFTLTH